MYTRASVFCICCCVIFFTHVASAEPPQADLEAGGFMYQRNCARCHGVTGMGDGPDASHLFPRPRNLTAGVYKLRTTESGTPPTDADLFRSITHGLHGAPMPDWQNLSDDERWQLVYYLKSLSPMFDQFDPEPITLPPRPKKLDVAHGNTVFNNLGCVQCHGTNGRGNGPSAAALTDDAGQPIVPTNLTQGWNYRGGAELEDIVWRMMSGMDGTPMPSYAEAAPGPDVWHLSAYVQSLQQPPRWERAVRATRANGALPTTATDPQWQDVPPTDIRLTSRVYQTHTMQHTMVNAASVQALYGEDAIAFRIAWFDRTENRSPLPDVLALVLRAPEQQGDQITMQNWPLPDTNATETLNLCVWSANARTVQEHVGVDFEPTDGRIGIRPTEATFEDGQWVLLFQRPLRPSRLPHGVTVEPGTPVRMALVAWDGGNEEHGRLHASSTWLDLTLHEHH